MELQDILDRVRDRESFLDFVDALIKDRETADAKEREHPTEYPGLCPDAGGWYNTTIEGYLEASLAWANARGTDWPGGHSEPEMWQAFAGFLYVGKIYE